MKSAFRSNQREYEPDCSARSSNTTPLEFVSLRGIRPIETCDGSLLNVNALAFIGLIILWGVQNCSAFDGSAEVCLDSPLSTVPARTIVLAFSPTLTTMVFDHSSMRGLRSATRSLNRKGPPSPLVQLCIAVWTGDARATRPEADI
jgi:hypothetical protein